MKPHHQEFSRIEEEFRKQTAEWQAICESLESIGSSALLPREILDQFDAVFETDVVRREPSAAIQPHALRV